MLIKLYCIFFDFFFGNTVFVLINVVLLSFLYLFIQKLIEYTVWTSHCDGFKELIVYLLGYSQQFCD